MLVSIKEKKVDTLERPYLENGRKYIPVFLRDYYEGSS